MSLTSVARICATFRALEEARNVAKLRLSGRTLHNHRATTSCPKQVRIRGWIEMVSRWQGKRV